MPSDDKVTKAHMDLARRAKNALNFPEDHPMNTPTKFGSNRAGGFREEDTFGPLVLIK